MGQVWEAQRSSLGRAVEWKLVRPERVSEKTLELFAHEARAGGRHHHTHLVAVHARCAKRRCGAGRSKPERPLYLGPGLCDGVSRPD